MHAISRVRPQRGLLRALLLAGLLVVGRGNAHAESLGSTSTQAGPTSILPACVACFPGDLTLVDLGPTTPPTQTLQTLPMGGYLPAARLIEVQYNGGTPQQYVKNVQVKASNGIWQASGSSLLTIPVLESAGGHVTVELTGWAGTTSTVTVDPNNVVSETNELNNTITVKFS